jgi:hypothetical protein
MASTCPHGGGLLTEPKDDRGKQQKTVGAADAPALPRAELFEAPDWMKSYGMPLAISCSFGYSLVGLAMVEPTAPWILFNPVAILFLVTFAIGFLKGMQWWTSAAHSGKAVICPHCGKRVVLGTLDMTLLSQRCRCGEAYSAG